MASINVTEAFRRAHLHELPYTRVNVLLVLASHPKVSLKTISARTGLDEAAARQHIIRLRGRGLAAWVVNKEEGVPPGRKPEHLHFLTPEGLKMAAAFMDPDTVFANKQFAQCAN